jgi:REG-2-like HAD superfamily hydrolase
VTELPTPGPGTALLLDAAGTLLRPRQPIAETYAAVAARHGVVITAEQIRPRFGPIMRQATPLRAATADWREFWAAVVTHCTGSDDVELLEELLAWFRRPAAWRVAAGAERCVSLARATGMKVGLVSNWDEHLRPLLAALEIADWFDTIVVSAEIQIEKPDPRMFALACARLGVAPFSTVHVGDDPHADIVGARAAGCQALLFGSDVADFDALAHRLGLVD